MAAQDAKEDVKSTARLLYDFSAQMISFGPVLATKMSYYSTISLPWGLGTAGAETVKRGVDTDNAEGISTMTACMVRLGMLGTVHDIVVSLCEQDRADAVAEVTAGLLSQGEVVIVTRITNSLVASGHSEHAVTISGHLISQGNTQIYEVIKEAGLNMGILGGSSDSDGKDSEGKNQSESSSKASRQGGASSSGGGPLSLKALDNFRREGAAIWQDAQKQGAALLDIMKPSGESEGRKKGEGQGKESPEEPGAKEQGSISKKASTPDADALFEDWSRTKSGPSQTSNPESKNERLI